MKENASTNSNDSGMSLNSLRDFFYVLFRHKIKVSLVLLSVMTAAALVAILPPSIYESEAKLLVRVGREATLDPTVTTGPVVAVMQSREAEINSELEILRSEELVRDVVADIGPAAFVTVAGSDEEVQEGDAEGVIGSVVKSVREAQGVLRSLPDALQLRESLTDFDKAVLSVQKNLNVEVVKRANIITVAYRSKDPQLAQDVVARLIDVYQNRRQSIRRTSGSYGFFDRQVNDLQKELTALEEKLLELKNQHGLISIEDQRRVFTERLSALEQQVAANEAELASAKARVQTVEHLLADLPAVIETSRRTTSRTHGSDLKDQYLYQLKARQEELHAKFKPGSIEVATIDRQVAEMEKLLEEGIEPSTEVTMGVNLAHQQVKQLVGTERAALASLEAKAAVLNRQLADAQSLVDELNEIEIEVARLERQRTIKEDDHKKYAGNREQARIDEALETEKLSNVSRVQSATYPKKPVGPRRFLFLVIGFIMAVGGALGIAFMSEYTDHSLKKPEDVEERLQVPALVSIPMMRRRAFVPVRINLGNGTQPPRPTRATEPPPLEWDTSQRVSPYFETLQNRIVLSSNGSTAPCPVIGVTSCRFGEGTSTVAVNLAVRLSRREARRVLFASTVDRPFNYRKLLNIKRDHEKRDIVYDQNTTKLTIRPSRIGKLDLLFGFPHYYDSEVLENVLRVLRQHYSIVILDLPPILDDMKGIRWASLADGVVLVLEAERVRWEVAHRAKEVLREARVNVLGAVLNKRRFPIPRWIYRVLVS